MGFVCIFFFFSNFIVPTTEEFHGDGIENQKVLFFFPSEIHSASYLYASLPVTRRPQQGPEALGWPWSSAYCLPAGGAAPRPCKAACLLQAGGGVPSWGWSGPTALPLAPSQSSSKTLSQEDVHQVTTPFLNPDSREYPSKPFHSTSATILVCCMQGLWK